MTTLLSLQVQDSDFDCEACTNIVDQALRSAPGVEEFTVEPDGRLDVIFDADAMTAPTIERIIEKQGYSVGWTERRTQ